MARCLRCGADNSWIEGAVKACADDSNCEPPIEPIRLRKIVDAAFERLSADRVPLAVYQQNAIRAAMLAVAKEV